MLQINKGSKETIFFFLKILVNATMCFNKLNVIWFGFTSTLTKLNKLLNIFS